MLDLAYPWLLLALPLPWLLKKKRQPLGSALNLPALAKLGRQQEVKVELTRVAPYCAALIWVLLVISATQPRWLGEPISLPQPGRELMLALDLSGSMNTPDMATPTGNITRLDAMKTVLRDFIAARQGDRVGLILFADAAYQQTPLTFDLVTVQRFLEESVIGLVGQRTAIGEAVGLTVKRLNTYDASNKVLILLSDGANNAGDIDPMQALTLAKAAGIKIYTVGLGAEQMIQQSLFGQRVINPSQDLDEPLLIKLAEETGGRYFRARNPQELDAIYTLLDELEPIEREEVTFRPQRSLVHWSLAAALLLSFFLAWRQINWSGVFKHAR
ncbi:vWA domain-containing protein [Alishewanella tabrizica]|uniref:VWR domain protein in aerotolerance operon BatA n=1 Tax=Alishewanella tabrizica TaxID=671278 RepID=A0ABQ2WLB6_9ALTE|nr:VWA domain-containing protein [Alishewanella tabrizica]GGW62423.1 VWR domain protein in aerotolerance operon BatA [Alishewanella tabrizica]